MDFFLLGYCFILTIIIVMIIVMSINSTTKQAQRNIISTLPYPSLLIDKKDRIIANNAAAEKLFKKSSKEMHNQQIDTLMPLKQDDKQVLFKQYQTQGPLTEQTFSLTITPDTAKQVQITLASLNAQQKNSQHFLSIHDRANEQQLEEMKVDFVSMAAHELRTPLTAIRGYTSLLQMHYGNQFTGPAKELLTRLLVSTNNLTNLIDNLLSVSRIERNSMIVDLKPVDMKELITEIFQSFKQQAETRHQILTLNMPDKLATVTVDPFRIGQVFINLISNAINYTPENGKITITVIDEQSAIRVSIQDTGEGIPTEAMPRLFTKFFRVSNSLEQGSKGTGLGLYITKSIVEMHKGKIWAESTMGKGSTFTFTIPHATAEELEKYQQHIQSNENNFLTVKNTQGIIVRKANKPS